MSQNPLYHQHCSVGCSTAPIARPMACLCWVSFSAVDRLEGLLHVVSSTAEVVSYSRFGKHVLQLVTRICGNRTAKEFKGDSVDNGGQSCMQHGCLTCVSTDNWAFVCNSESQLEICGQYSMSRPAWRPGCVAGPPVWLWAGILRFVEFRRCGTAPQAMILSSSRRLAWNSSLCFW